MAIAAGDWSSLTDPFILALDHTHTGSLGDLSNDRLVLYGTEGYIGGVTSDKDVQEAFWQLDAAPENSWSVSAVDSAGLGPNPVSYEAGVWYIFDGTNYVPWRAYDYFEADPKTMDIYVTGRENGPNKFSLFVYTAYVWADRDPAQIIFSWLAHHTPSVFDLKDFMSQASFQAASDYYDANPVRLFLWREVGLSIADQIKKVMQHTSDILTIAPDDTTGELTLQIIPRAADLVERATAIDLDSRSVASYSYRPTDRYTVDRIDASYGAVYGRKQSGLPSSAGDYDQSIPLDISGVNRTLLRQHAGQAIPKKTIQLELPYHIRRGNIANHIPLEYWSQDQAEIDIEFADWTHLNFKSGDLVPITGASAGLVAKYFLCTKKRVDLNTLLATASFIEVAPPAGKRPVYADADNLIYSLTPASLGDFFEASATFPRLAPVTESPRNLDRIWDMSDHHRHLKLCTNDTPPSPAMSVVPDSVRRWPALTNGGASGEQWQYTLEDSRTLRPTPSGGSDYTFYFVIDQGAFGLASQMLFAAKSPAGTDDLTIYAAGGINVGYNDGSSMNRGTAPPVLGLQLLTFVLASTGASIRRNGAVLDSGLPYTQRDIYGGGANAQALGVSPLVDSGHFIGSYLEAHIFDVAHSGATLSDIETYLMAKYGI